MQRGSPIVVVGSSNSDMIIQLDHLPRPGETVIGGKFSTAAGGKGANQAVAAARAGGRVAFVARVGGDELGAAALAGFRCDGIDVRHVSRDPAHRSGVAFILVDRHGENSIAVASGANGHLRPADVRKAAPLLRRAGVLLTQLETPLTAVTAAVELVSAAGGTVILNPAPGRPLPRRLLRQVSVLTPNESEAELLTGIKLTHHVAVEKAAARLRALGARAVVITLAARGVFVADDVTHDFFPGFKVTARDTTAAGDIFNGALAVALAERTPLAAAVRFAQAAAALSVTRLGAQSSAPARAEIEQFLATHNRSKTNRSI
jgi:ribokinase